VAARTPPDQEKPASSANGGRNRLLGHAVLGVALLGGVLAASPAVGRYLLERSDSSGVNLLLQSGLMALVLVGSYGFAAALLGSMSLSPGPRSRLLAVTLVLVSLGMVLLANQLAEGAFFRQREVLYRSALRSANVPLKIRILREIADSGQREVLEAFVPVIWRAQSVEPVAEAREAMLGTLAELAERMRKSVLIRHNAMELQGWEQALLGEMRATLVDGLVALFREGSPGVQRPAFRALLHLDAQRAVDLAAIYANHPQPDRDLQLDLASLLSQSGLLKACEVLTGLLAATDLEVRTAALIGQARLLRLFTPEKGGREMPEFARFHQRLMQQVRSREPQELCPALEALEYMKDARFGEPLMGLLLDASLRDRACPALVLKDHLGREDVLVRDEGLPLKVLRSLSQIAVGNPPVESFLQARLEDPGFEFLRGEIRAILQQVEAARQEEGQ
jgi:hypothetical protein